MGSRGKSSADSVRHTKSVLHRICDVQLTHRDLGRLKVLISTDTVCPETSFNV
jgi:hypothetical protein